MSVVMVMVVLLVAVAVVLVSGLRRPRDRTSTNAVAESRGGGYERCPNVFSARAKKDGSRLLLSLWHLAR